MANIFKVIDKMKRQPNGIRPQEAEKVLIDAGYYLDNSRGSHRQYRHKNKKPFTMVWENPLERYQVKEILKLVIDEE